MLRHRMRRIALPVIALSALAAAPSAASASCVFAPTAAAVAQADIVFVGTVTATAQGELWATVRVEEVWRGPDLPAVLQVHGGQGGNIATSVDRAFEVGVKYLFAPGQLENGVAIDNACSPTREWDAGLAALRPATAHPPIGGAALPPQPGFDLVRVLAPVAVALLVVGALFAIALLARGRQPD